METEQEKPGIGFFSSNPYGPSPFRSTENQPRKMISVFVGINRMSKRKEQGKDALYISNQAQNKGKVVPIKRIEFTEELHNVLEKAKGYFLYYILSIRPEGWKR